MTLEVRKKMLKSPTKHLQFNEQNNKHKSHPKVKNMSVKRKQIEVYHMQKRKKYL